MSVVHIYIILLKLKTWQENGRSFVVKIAFHMTFLKTVVISWISEVWSACSLSYLSKFWVNWNALWRVKRRMENLFTTRFLTAEIKQWLNIRFCCFQPYIIWDNMWKKTLKKKPWKKKHFFWLFLLKFGFFLKNQNTFFEIMSEKKAGFDIFRKKLKEKKIKKIILQMDSDRKLHSRSYE